MRKAQGFTLIELLVVIAIIALLVGMLLPALGADHKAPNATFGGNLGNGSAWNPRGAKWTGNVVWGNAHVDGRTTPTRITRAGLGNMYANDAHYSGGGFSINGRYDNT